MFTVMALCEVIIPYYQRKPGLLARAISSVFAQGIDDVRVIVIDDGSPHPARYDLDTLPEIQRPRITLVEQRNQGATCARNRALETTSIDAGFVALLDSDDEWAPGHLARAINTLRRPGATLFYSLVEADESFSESYSRPSAILPVGLLKPVAGTSSLSRITDPYRLLSGEWFRHMHLSVTVLKGELARKVRFNPSFSVAEDFQFFFACACEGGDWYVDETVGARRGTGENIWHGIGPAELRYSQEKFFSAKVLSEILRQPNLASEARAEARQRLNIYREQFYWAQRSRLTEGKGLNFDLWARFFKNDPGLAGFLAGRVFPRGNTS
ncbi:MAG: hypothetical protein B7X55_01985 [Rhodobacterales bacterium 34-62-10]|nr:MAG: hypothetical protein B7X55_01985 [Rhodobacterales bacterium 34-62-10]